MSVVVASTSRSGGHLLQFRGRERLGRDHRLENRLGFYTAHSGLPLLPGVVQFHDARLAAGFTVGC